MTDAAAIRPAVAADVGAITAIYNEAVVRTTASWDLAEVDEQNRRGWLADHTRDGYATLVAELDGVVVGFAAFGSFRTKAGYAATVEHSVYLSATARRHGLGTRLLTALIDLARERGFHAMVGGLSAENHDSLRLHDRLGFVEVARMPQVGQKFGRWLDLVFVQLILDDAAAPPAAGSGALNR